MVNFINPDDFYDPDDVGLMDSPRLKPTRPTLNPRPPGPISVDLIGDDSENDAENYGIDEVDFSLQSSKPPGVKLLPSRQDEVLINLLGGGKALHVARTAARELLASDDGMSDDDLSVAVKIARRAQSEEGATFDLATLTAGALKFARISPTSPIALADDPAQAKSTDELAKIVAPSPKSETSNGGGSTFSDYSKLAEAVKATTASMGALNEHWPLSSSIAHSPPGPLLLQVPEGGHYTPPLDNFRRESQSPSRGRVTGASHYFDSNTRRLSPEKHRYLGDIPNDYSADFSHSSTHPHYCPVKGCPRAEGGKGFKRMYEMIRHGLIHETPGYVCPYCQYPDRKYAKPGNLVRHVAICHVDKDKDESRLRDVLCQGPMDKLTNFGLSFDLSSLLEGEMPELNPSLPAEAMTVESRRISPTRPKEWPSTDHIDTNKGRPVLRRETKGVELTSTDDEINEPRKVGQRSIGTSDDILFTDSGYSSLRHNLNHPLNSSSSLKEPQSPASTENSISMNDIDRDDAQTLYSAATTVGPVHAQNYIAELCADIYGKLRQCGNSKLWSSLSRDLPLLIKAFAIKIGHDSYAPVNQEIMYFLHRRHDQVFRQLEAMFQREDDAIPDSPRTERKGMSLRDKMSMWDSKAGEDRSVIETDDLYQGIKDDEDEITDRVDLPVYHKIILDSAAYEWFLASMRKEITLQWSATQPRVMIETIRQRILDMLPTGTISKRKTLGGHEVKFDLQWGDTFKRQFEQENYDQLIRSDQLLAELLTVTGSLEEAQVLTIKQYLSQTWSASGSRLLDLLQSTINSRYHHYSVILLDNTQLDARISGSRLTVTATGPAHFIAECGEQLAWVQAALFNQSQHCASYCTPSITSYWVDSSPSEKLNYEGYCQIGLNIAHSENLGDYASREPSSWQGLVESSFIIAGFPISRRPDNYPGLELSFDTFLHLLKAEKTSVVNRSVLLKGQSQTVQLMKHNDNIFLWHPLHNYNQGCSCCTDHHVGLNAVVFCASIDLHILNAGRHIFSDCAHLETAVGKDMHTSYLSTMADSSEVIRAQNCVFTEANYIDSLRLGHDQFSTGQNESLPVLPGFRNDTAVRNPSIPGRADHSISADGLPSFPKKYPEIDSLLGEAIPLATDSQSIATESPYDSLDSDFLSMSDFSEQMEPLNSGEPAYRLLNTFLQELLLGFRGITQCQQSPDEIGERSVPQSTATESSNTTGDSVQYRQKKREPDDDEVSEDGFRRPPRKKLNPGQGKMRQRTLACPYLKLNPTIHRKCCKYQLREIKYVKQHLHRQHTPEFYCQRCFKTDFRDQQNLQSHVNLGTCPIEDPSILEGISNQQQKQLSRKSNPRVSEEEQWFAIWTIVFPGVQRPLSAYIDPGLSEEMRLLREYVATHGPALLVEQIESNPAWSGMDVTLEQRQTHLNRVLGQGLNFIFDEYLRSVPSPDSAEDRSASSSGQLNQNVQPIRPATPTSSHSDSGVALGSQLSSSPSMSRTGLPDRQPSFERLNYQTDVAADNQVQDTPTTQEPVTEPTQNHIQNLQDPTLDCYFDDQFLDVGWSTTDQNPGFEIGSKPDFWSEFSSTYKT